MTTAVMTDLDAARLSTVRDEHTASLEALRRDLARIDADLSIRAADTALGEKVAVRETARLNESRADVLRQIATAELVVDELGRRLRHWQDGEAKRRYQADLAALEKLSKQTDDLERAWEDAATAFAAVTADLLRHRLAWQTIANRVSSYQARHQVLGPTLRAPRKPAPLPDRYFREAKPYLSIENFLRTWRNPTP